MDLWPLVCQTRPLSSQPIFFTNECPGYDTKQSDGEASVKLELWGMQSTPLLASLPGPLWPGVVAPDEVLSLGQIEFNYVFKLNWIVFNRSVITFNCM